MRLTLYGLREWLGSGIIAAVLLVFSVTAALKFNSPVFWILSGLIVLVWLSIAAFFRVPNRKIPTAPELVVSPADGLVKDIEYLNDHDIEVFAGRSLIRVGIFLSVFDVHVNRAPADLKVTYKKYRPGRYLDARDSRCGKENEAMTIAGEATVNGVVIPVAVRQISGAIARRIVCPAEPGSTYQKGEIYGMIKFGSRTEIYLPAGKNIDLKVKVGDRVRSGTSIIAAVTGQD